MTNTPDPGTAELEEQIREQLIRSAEFGYSLSPHNKHRIEEAADMAMDVIIKPLLERERQQAKQEFAELVKRLCDFRINGANIDHDGRVVFAAFTGFKVQIDALLGGDK